MLLSLWATFPSTFVLSEKAASLPPGTLSREVAAPPSVTLPEEAASASTAAAAPPVIQPALSPYKRSNNYIGFVLG